MYDVVGAPAVEHVVVEAFVLELHPLSNAVSVKANKFNIGNLLEMQGWDALDAVLFRTLDIMIIDVYANKSHVFCNHFSRVAAERKRGADADVEHLCRREGGRVREGGRGLSDWSNREMLTSTNAHCTLEPLGMCFMTTPYHLPVKRPDTRASYLQRVMCETEYKCWSESARCDANSPHDLSDPAHEAVRTEGARHAAIVAECCWALERGGFSLPDAVAEAQGIA